MFGFMRIPLLNPLSLCWIMNNGSINLKIADKPSTISIRTYKIYHKTARMCFISSIFTGISLESTNYLKFHGHPSGKEEMTPILPNYLNIRINLLGSSSKISTIKLSNPYPTNNTTALPTLITIYKFLSSALFSSSTWLSFKWAQESSTST